MPHFNLVGNATFALRKDSLVNDIDKNYTLVLQAAKGQISCLYDAARRVAWLVPTLGLLLEMVHIHVRLKGNLRITDVPLAAENPDPDESYYNTMAQSAHVWLRPENKKQELRGFDNVAKYLNGKFGTEVASTTWPYIKAELSKKSHPEQSSGDGRFELPASVFDLHEFEFKACLLLGLERYESEDLLQRSQKLFEKSQVGGCGFADIVLHFYGTIQMAKFNKPPKKLLPRRVRSSSQILRGWELMDIIEMAPSIRGSALKLNDSADYWPGITLDIPTFVAANLSDIVHLKLDDRSPVCSHCKVIPTGCDVLVAQLRMLEQLSKRRGYDAQLHKSTTLSVGKDLWYRPVEQFRDCRGSECWDG